MASGRTEPHNSSLFMWGKGLSPWGRIAGALEAGRLGGVGHNRLCVDPQNCCIDLSTSQF